MTALVLAMSISQDGFIAPPDRGGAWVMTGSTEASRAWKVDTISRASRHLMGAEAYRVMADTWPSSPLPFAEPMNRIPKVVFSSSLTTADWGPATIVAGDLAEAVAELKAEPAEGYLLAHGGSRFARSLADTGLVDEYRLLIHPVILGGGDRLFHQPLTVETRSMTSFPGGAAAHVFTVSPSAGPR